MSVYTEAIGAKLQTRGAGASLGTSKTSAHTVCKKIVYDMKEISRSTRLGLQCQTPIEVKPLR